MRILITGSAGYLGSKAVSILKKKGHEIFGIDIRMPGDTNLYKSFVKGSVADDAAMAKIFEAARPDAAVHLAFVVNALHDEKKEETIDVKGTELFLRHCELYKVPKVVFMSSAAAYGAHPGAGMPLAESSLVRGNRNYSYSRLKEMTDRMGQEFMKGHPECAFVMLRPCLFVGPNTDNSFFEVLKFPLLPQISDAEGVRDVEFQFIHEDDMAECLVSSLEKDVRGIFNVAGDGTVRFSEIARIAGKRTIALPAWLLYPLTSILWRLRLISSPPGQLDFMRYPWLVNNSRMKAELFTPLRSSPDAFREFADRFRKSTR
jgi:UDP-glucose 4-epimerase